MPSLPPSLPLQVSQALERSVPHGRYLVFQTSEFEADHPTGGVRRKLAAPQRRLAVSKPVRRLQHRLRCCGACR